ncbi:MAG TPA: DNA internalization-related competence protein ComEC/Rec2 [Burkholderiaceae bacterium]|nr:DNA internalization-related competence protein ComEC/Rec2 [Burkholderiaceae bacterium]
MRPAWSLAAFVAGAWLLQQQAALPGSGVLLPATFLASAVLLVAALLHARAARWMLPRVERTRLARNAILPLAALVLGASHAAWLAKWRLADELAFASEGRDVCIVGVVASLPAQLSRGTRFEFDVEAVETPGIEVPAHISIGWFADQAQVRAGERWRFVARLRRPHATLNPGGFDLEAWMLERNLRAAGYIRDGQMQPRRIDTMVWRLGYAIDRARDVLRGKLQERLGGARYGGVLVALVLGDQRAIREEDWLLFNRTGISHLVSISGLHITMIAGMLAVVAGKIWRRSPWALSLAPAQSAAAFAAMAAAWGYCLLAGWGVPAQRTFFMLSTVAVATLLRLGTGPATTLALAAATVTLLDPWAVLAPGFWLSFGAVAAIFLSVEGRPNLRNPGWRAHLREAARIQLVVTVALIPLTVVLFQQVSLVSPMANAVAIPLVSLLITPLSLAGASLAAFPEPLASLAVPLLALAHFLMTLLADLLTWSLKWRAASIALPAPALWVAALGMLGAAWLLAPPGWPLRWAGAVWLLPLFVWPAERPRTGELWVTALDVGQGAALVVEAQGHVVLYDSGPRYSPQADAGSRIVLPYLRTRGIERIDVLVLSHLDSDHSGGAVALLKALEIRETWTSIDAAHPILSAAGPVRRCQAGVSEEIDGLQLSVLHPTAAQYAVPGRSTNARSCVVEVRLGRTRVLLTGDLPAAQELELLSRVADLHARLLTMPHHGSRHSSSDPFVRAVAPTWVVAQAGYRNRFGHPDPIVVGRYLGVGARIVRTDFAGATQWRFAADGGESVRRERIDGARYWHNQPARAPGTRTGTDGDEAMPREASAFEMPSPRD